MKNKLVNPKSIVLVSIFICFHLISNVTSSLSFNEIDEITNLNDNPSALQNPGKCGNGILEGKETCDCGRKDCGNCCDGKTCVLNSTACCGSGPCCNPKTCFPYAKIDNVICRKAVDDCDLPEYCDGVNEFCPENRYKQDGILCKSQFPARCFRGKCGNHDLQCKKLWGPTVNYAHWLCFHSKLKGKSTFPCGIAGGKGNMTQMNCSADDTTCGLLYCDAKADTKLFIKDSFTGNKSHKVVNGSNCLSYEGSIAAMDPGLVPDGSPCGFSFSGMCVGVKCVPVATILQQNKGCARNCSGHGICNNVGQCHCDPLYTKADCSVEISKNMSKPMNVSKPNPAGLIFKPSSKDIEECREKMGISTTSASSKPINVSTFTLAIIIGFLLSVLVSVAVLWNLYHRYGSSNTEDSRPAATPTRPAPTPAPAQANPANQPN